MASVTLNIANLELLANIARDEVSRDRGVGDHHVHLTTRLNNRLVAVIIVDSNNKDKASIEIIEQLPVKS